MKPHKHAEIIKAWADGAEIEVYDGLHDRWCDLTNSCPAWTSQRYRIKPEPKPDIVVSRWVYQDGSTAHCSQSNVKYIFDGETGKLKSAEVIA